MTATHAADAPAGSVEVDDLPPTQYLILDVLAARYRTGEQLWTFPSTLRPAIRALEAQGLVSSMHGITYKTVRVRLTDKGRAEVIKADYVPPQPVLPAGTETVEEWSVRWAWPDDMTETMECNRPRGPKDTRTPRERARDLASHHIGKGITGEVLRRFVHTTPDEVVERHEGQERPNE